jgi:outer membrane immunogenic protein
MNKVAIGVALATILTGAAPALAADLPISVKALPQPPVQVWSWTGFYMGGNFGYAWGKGDTSFTPLPTAAGFFALAPTTLPLGAQGVVGGLQAGYNWQVASWVFGLEADIQGADTKGSVTTSPIVQGNGTPIGAGSYLTASEDLKMFGTVRGRLGFTPVDRWLVYGTGGVAYGDIAYGGNTNFFPVGNLQYPVNFSATRAGWTVGGGAEWAFWGHWSAKLEYLYYDLGSESRIANSFPATAPGHCGSFPLLCQVGYDWHTNGQVLRVGLNYKLMDAPVFASGMAARVPPRRDVPAAPSWSGCYLGIEGGGAWGSSQHVAGIAHNSVVGLPITNPFGVNGGMFGGTAGCSAQISSLVIGAENDISWTDLRGSGPDIPPFGAGSVSTSDQKWMDTLRGRVGFAWDRFLVYGTAGAAFAREGVKVCVAAGICVTDAQTRTGWAAGAGGEWAAWSFAGGALSLKVEYLHADFGTGLFLSPPAVVARALFDGREVKFSDDIVRGGINLRFTGL